MEKENLSKNKFELNLFNITINMVIYKITNDKCD